MSQKQAYTNKNKNAFSEYEEQLKNGTAQHITHYTEEQLKELFDKEEQAQKKGKDFFLSCLTYSYLLPSKSRPPAAGRRLRIRRIIKGLFT